MSETRTRAQIIDEIARLPADQRQERAEAAADELNISRPLFLASVEMRAAELAEPPRPRRGGRRTRAGGGEGGGGEDSAQREQAIAAVLDLHPNFWRDELGEACITINHDGATKRYRVHSEAFKQVVRLIYGESGTQAGRMRSIGTRALSEAISSLSAQALRAPMRKAAVRCCFGDNDRSTIWIDVGDDAWSIIKVTARGWEVVAGADVPLLRPAGVLPMRMPLRSNDPNEAVKKLRRICNVKTPEGFSETDAPDFMLIALWLVAALYPEGPYTVLAFDGEQGSGKTWVVKACRYFVDPSAVRRDPDCHVVLPIIDPANLLERANDCLAGPLAELLYAANWEHDVVLRMLHRRGYAALDTLRHSRHDVARLQDELALLPAALSALAEHLARRLIGDMRDVPDRTWQRIDTALDLMHVGETITLSTVEKAA